MAFRANQQPREDIWNYRQTAPASEPENVLSFSQPNYSQPAAKTYSTTALNLVQQAAEIFSGMEDRARETEARAQSLCESLAEKLRVSEMQKEASERARREAVHELNAKIQDIGRAMQQAQSRIASAEDRATAAEFRAQAAESQLYKANRELAAVEEAIRKRLL